VVVAVVDLVLLVLRQLELLILVVVVVDQAVLARPQMTEPPAQVDQV